MRKFLLLALAGLGAQLVDGSLGMAYGVSSTTLFLARGGACVGVCGGAHSRDRDDGGVGHLAREFRQRGLVQDRLDGGSRWYRCAFAGAYLLVWASYAGGDRWPRLSRSWPYSSSPRRVRPQPFRFQEAGASGRGQACSSREFLTPLGLVAGFLDAIGGGGWGPISTPTLLSSGRMEPRKIIGTVDTSEFVVALCASLGFLFGLSFAEIPWQVVGALLLGGTVAAPLAAYIVRLLPARILGTAVGGVILVVNAQTFFGAIGVTGSARHRRLLPDPSGLVAAMAFAIAAIRRDR